MNLEITNGWNDEQVVDSVFTYWGSAMRSEIDSVISVLTFGEGIVSYQPKTAWRFNENTEEVRVSGWSQALIVKKGKGKAIVLGDTGIFMAAFVGENRIGVGLNSKKASQNVPFIRNIFFWLTN